MKQLCFAPAILLILLSLASAAPIAEPAGPAASLAIEGEAIQPAVAPVLLELVIQNTGSVPLRYWCGGPGEYPNATDFLATLTFRGAHATSVQVALSNGQVSSGSGRAIELARGRTVRVPASLDPLQPGEYEIAVAGNALSSGAEAGSTKPITWQTTHSIAPFRLTVRADADLLATRDRRIVAGVRAGEAFARHVSSTWPRQPVRDELIKDVSGDDVLTADRAADGLWGDGDPAALDGPLVAEVILKHLQPPKEGSDVGILSKLMKRSVNRPFDSREVRVALAKLAVARADSMVGERASAALGLDGKDGNNDFVQTMVGRVRGSDANQPPYLAALLGLVTSQDADERRLAMRRLAGFPGDPDAIRAARAGLVDKDPYCRKEAALTLTLIVPPRTPDSQPSP